MSAIQDFLKKHGLKAKFVGGALVVSCAYGSCQLMGPGEAPEDGDAVEMSEEVEDNAAVESDGDAGSEAVASEENPS